jgi:hypothetical protein
MQWGLYVESPTPHGKSFLVSVPRTKKSFPGNSGLVTHHFEFVLIPKDIPALLVNLIAVARRRAIRSLILAAVLSRQFGTCDKLSSGLH